MTFDCRLNVHSGVDERGDDNNEPEKSVNPRLCAVANLSQAMNASRTAKLIKVKLYLLKFSHFFRRTSIIEYTTETTRIFERNF